MKTYGITEEQAFELVSKEDMESYEEIRVSGVFNMFDPIIQRYAKLTSAQHQAIILHYQALCREYLPERYAAIGVR